MNYSSILPDLTLQFQSLSKLTIAFNKMIMLIATKSDEIITDFIKKQSFDFERQEKNYNSIFLPTKCVLQKTIRFNFVYFGTKIEVCQL